MVYYGFPYEVLQAYHKTRDFSHIVHGVYRRIPLDILLGHRRANAVEPPFSSDDPPHLAYCSKTIPRYTFHPPDPDS